MEESFEPTGVPLDVLMLGSNRSGEAFKRVSAALDQAQRLWNQLKLIEKKCEGSCEPFVDREFQEVGLQFSVAFLEYTTLHTRYIFEHILPRPWCINGNQVQAPNAEPTEKRSS